jgi:hypothetical protein
MTMSSPATPGRSGYISEPPLSPGAGPPVTPMSARSPQNQPSIEAQVVRLGLMTPDQVATAMREEAETGRSFDEIVTAHGWVSEEDLARVREPVAVAAVPAPPPVTIVPDPDPEPEPQVVEPEVVQPEVFEPAANATAASVFVRLSNGERLAAGAYDSEASAESRARDLMRALDGDADWPQLDGRFIRPDAVVSIDVELTS